MEDDALSPVAVVVLGQLARGPKHAYEVYRTLKQHGEERRVKLTVGAVYHAVDRLERLEYVAAAGTRREGGRPERTIYAITDAGRQAYLCSVRALVRRPRPSYPAFEIGLSQLAALPRDAAIQALSERREAIAEDRGSLAAMLDRVLGEGLPRRFLLDGLYEVDALEHQLRWIDTIVSQLGSDELDWDGPVPARFRQPGAGASDPDHP
jgi:DNA-binding PadR family transcriptional regulator